MAQEKVESCNESVDTTSSATGINAIDQLVNTFISVPTEMGGSFNCGAFLAGIVQGCQDGAEVPAEVTAQSVDSEAGTYPPKTYIVVKFAAAVVERERRMA